MLLLFASLQASAARGAEIAGVALDDDIAVAGVPLVLNGAGLRTRFMLEVYVIGLYVRARTTSADAVIKTGSIPVAPSSAQPTSISMMYGTGLIRATPALSTSE